MVVLESDTEMESDTELSLILGLEVRILVGKVDPITWSKTINDRK